MRTLTIKRSKSFAACFVKSKVYIEDPKANDLVINGVNCRLLGFIKNGEEQSFFINDTESNVYVIVDKLSKNYCNDFHNIPAGLDDIYLSGKHEFKPMSGNPFRFDDVTDPEVLKNRDKGRSKGHIITIAALVIGVVIGFVLSTSLFSEADSKQFHVSGMTMTLTEDFKSSGMDGYDAHFASEKADIYLIKENVSDFEGGQALSIADYANGWIGKSNASNDVELKNDDGLTYFEYKETGEDGKRYEHFVAVYKANNAFWYVRFSTFENDYEDLRDSFVKWAKLATFEQ